jgi:hypothetical protein
MWHLRCLVAKKKQTPEPEPVVSLNVASSSLPATLVNAPVGVFGHLRRLAAGFWFLVSGFWFLVSGFWFLVSGFWFLVSGFWFLQAQGLLASGFCKHRGSFYGGA